MQPAAANNDSLIETSWFRPFTNHMFWRCLKQVSFQWLKKNICFHWNFHRHPIVLRTIELYASAPNQWLVSRLQLSQPCQTVQIGKLTAYPLKRPGSQSKSIAGIWWFVFSSNLAPAFAVSFRIFNEASRLKWLLSAGSISTSSKHAVEGSDSFSGDSCSILVLQCNNLVRWS